MIKDRAGLMRQIDDATERLMGTVSRLTDEDVRGQSLLPGWTRGHVLTHVARGGDALRNLTTWARTGVETPAYKSQQARDAAIDAGAGRSAAELLADVAESATAFRDAAGIVPEAAWQVAVSAPNTPEFPAEQLILRRLVEVELHHTDLGAGYRPGDWPAEFAAMELPEPMRSQREDRRSWFTPRASHATATP
jgi:maleylpyruvate isomerase